MPNKYIQEQLKSTLSAQTQQYRLFLQLIKSLLLQYA